MLRAYGAEIVLTPGAAGMKGAVEKANELVEQNEGAILARQFENEANPKIHYATTGPEIWNDTDGQVDIVSNDRGRFRVRTVELDAVTRAVVDVDFSRPGVAELRLCGLDDAQIAQRRDTVGS